MTLNVSRCQYGNSAPSVTHTRAQSSARVPLGMRIMISVSAMRPHGRIALVAIVSALAAIPVWLPAFPPMTDMPQHAAQVAMLREISHNAFPYSDLFEINWFTPYLVGYLLVYALTGLLGI